MAFNPLHANDQESKCADGLGQVAASETSAAGSLPHSHQFPPRYEIQDGRYYVTAEVMPNENSYLGPSVPGQRTLEISLYLRSRFGRSKKLRGKDEFRKILRHFDGHFDQIKGTWFRMGLDYELSDNLDRVNELTRGEKALPLEQAALQTWTGQQAVAAGYTEAKVLSVEGTPGQYTSVSVVFRRPLLRN